VRSDFQKVEILVQLASNQSRRTIQVDAVPYLERLTHALSCAAKRLLTQSSVLDISFSDTQKILRDEVMWARLHVLKLRNRQSDSYTPERIPSPHSKNEGEWEMHFGSEYYEALKVLGAKLLKLPLDGTTTEDGLYAEATNADVRKRAFLALVAYRVQQRQEGIAHNGTNSKRESFHQLLRDYKICFRRLERGNAFTTLRFFENVFDNPKPTCSPEPSSQGQYRFPRRTTAPPSPKP
jgi:hypothetical protein